MKIKLFSPNMYVKSTFEIDFDMLKEKGIKLLCFDLDNTLDFPDKLTVTKNEELDSFLKNLKKDFEILIVSNNTIENRVSSFAKIYNLNFIEAMKKPFKKKYKNDIILKYKKEEVVFIGDKLVTDVLGANRLKYNSILVDPLYPMHKTWYTNIMVFSDTIFSVFTGVKRGKYIKWTNYER